MQLDFEVDPQTGQIAPVATIEPLPLTAGATRNGSVELNEFGEVVGLLDFPGSPSEPYFFGESIRFLSSVTSSGAFANDLNAGGSIVGWSYEPALEGGRGALATLWQPNASGGFTATNLNPQIPSKPDWYLRNAMGLNDLGWIVGHGRKFDKGKTTWTGFLLVPN